MRHRVDGAARAASDVTNIPIINAGDGANQHPTQTLLDLYTMNDEFGTIDTLNIGILGDLKYGRTAHSLAMALSHYNVRVFLISCEVLKMPDHFKLYLQDKKGKFEETNSLTDIGHLLDVLYVTRIQRERFADIQEYEQVAHSYRITKDTLSVLNPKIKIMHPLPRVDEIAYEVDKTENAIYFKQAHNGIQVRQAILGLLTGAIE
jgi:aspartate carbamoyltransferase catalytic subunit